MNASCRRGEHFECWGAYLVSAWERERLCLCACHNGRFEEASS